LGAGAGYEHWAALRARAPECLMGCTALPSVRWRGETVRVSYLAWSLSADEAKLGLELP